MTTELDRLHSLYLYIDRCRILDNLKKRICSLEDLVDALDRDIEEAKMMGLDAGQLEEMCASRNSIDQIKIELALKANEIEHYILLFQQTIYSED